MRNNISKKTEKDSVLVFIVPILMIFIGCLMIAKPALRHSKTLVEETLVRTQKTVRDLASATLSPPTLEPEVLARKLKSTTP